MAKKNLHIQTFGCQMNVHDSEKIMALMRECGYEYTDDAKTADLLIINTCSIREKAEQKVYSQLGRFRKLKSVRPHLIIGVGGCLAQQKGNEIIWKYPFVDLVFGTHKIHKIPELLSAIECARAPVVETSFSKSVRSLGMLALPQNGNMSAHVTIMQGCNNYCAFCVVPFLRGREESRPPHEIIEEINILATHGVREVTLLGQNVNSYGHTLGHNYDFADLMQEIGNINGIERIRFTTSHPKDLSEKLMNCFATTEKLCEHIHLPVQSGSDRILQMMNRGYTACDYMKKVDSLRAICPEIRITTDIIVGFPGETEEDFKATLDLMEQVRFDGAFSFKYSERAGTAAFGLGQKVPESVKRERLKTLQLLQDSHAMESNKSLIGRNVEILVEGYSKKNSREDVIGRTRSNRIINLRGNSKLFGRTVYVVITEAYSHSLRGDLL